MNKLLLIILTYLLLSGAFIFNFSKSHNHLPTGCDEFGYLQLSEEFDKTNERTLFLNPLISDLKEKEFDYREYAWLITPHAYHIAKEKSVPVNQYQPGTSFLLSFFAKDVKQILFPGLVVLLSGLIAFIFSLNSKNNKLHQLIFTFLSISFFAVPFLSEFSRINSLAFTFPLLLVAGAIFKDKPFAALLLVVFSINFRIANALIAIPFGIWFLWKGKPFDNFWKWGLLLLALLPILLYQWMVMGNPIATTYSANDLGFNNLTQAVANLKYYFDFGKGWFKVHFILLMIFGGLFFYKKEFRSTILFWLILTGINYLYFLFHSIQINYYPYATAIIGMGILGDFIFRIVAFKHFQKILLGIALVVFIISCVRYNQKNIKSLETNNTEQQLMGAVANVDVVWGNMYTGTTEYVHHNHGMRYFAGTKRSRLFVVKWLKDHDYQQAFILNDLGLDKGVLLKELDSEEINFSIREVGKWEILILE